jgi:hypothetical protein
MSCHGFMTQTYGVGTETALVVYIVDALAPVLPNAASEFISNAIPGSDPVRIVRAHMMMSLPMHHVIMSL